MDARDDNGMVLRFDAHDSVATQSVAEDNVIYFPTLRPVDFFLDNRLHLLRRPMERLLQKNKRNSIRLKTEKFIPHDVAGNDEVFHRTPKFQIPILIGH
jgi:hypothetical protein